MNEELTLKQINICLQIINRLDQVDTPTGLFLNATWMKLSECIRTLPASYRKGKQLRIIGDKLTYDCLLPDDVNASDIASK